MRKTSFSNKLHKFKRALWPRMSFSRLLKYYQHRIGRLPGTPAMIAGGFAVGIAVSMTPFIGFHILMGWLVTLVLRVSLLGMIVGTVVAGNPWTFPLIWVGSYKIGKVLMAADASSSALTADTPLTFSALMDKPLELLLPMILGSLPLAIVFGLLSFYGVFFAVRRYKSQRISKRTGAT